MARHHTQFSLTQPAKSLMHIFPAEARGENSDDEKLIIKSKSKKRDKDNYDSDDEFEGLNEKEDDEFQPNSSRLKPSPTLLNIESQTKSQMPTQSKTRSQTQTQSKTRSQTQTQTKTQNQTQSQTQSLRDQIQLIFPQNGSNKSGVKTTMTCTIDGFLIFCFALSKHVDLNQTTSPIQSTLYQQMIKIADLIGRNKWHEARLEWISFTGKQVENETSKTKLYTFYGTENQSYVTQCLDIIQLYKFDNHCSNSFCKLVSIDDHSRALQLKCIFFHLKSLHSITNFLILSYTSQGIIFDDFVRKSKPCKEVKFESVGKCIRER